MSTFIIDFTRYRLLPQYRREYPYMTGVLSSCQVSFDHDRCPLIMTGVLSSWQVSSHHDRCPLIMTGVLSSWQVSSHHDRCPLIMTGVLSSWQVSSHHDRCPLIMTGVLSSWQVSSHHDRCPLIMTGVWRGFHDRTLCSKTSPGQRVSSHLGVHWRQVLLCTWYIHDPSLLKMEIPPRPSIRSYFITSNVTIKIQYSCNLYQYIGIISLSDCQINVLMCPWCCQLSLLFSIIDI